MPFPLPRDAKVDEIPWIRPKQEPMRFVGESERGGLQFRSGEEQCPSLFPGVNVIEPGESRVMHGMTVKIKDGFIESITKAKDLDLED